MFHYTPFSTGSWRRYVRRAGRAAGRAKAAGATVIEVVTEDTHALLSWYQTSACMGLHGVNQLRGFAPAPPGFMGKTIHINSGRKIMTDYVLGFYVQSSHLRRRARMRNSRSTYGGGTATASSRCRGVISRWRRNNCSNPAQHELIADFSRENNNSSTVLSCWLM